MKDPNDPHTLDLFDVAHLTESRAKSYRRYSKPCNTKRLDMWVSPRCFVQLDELARLHGYTKRQLVEDLLEREWQAAKVVMTQAELPGIE